MTPLSKEQILGADDCQPELIKVPEWGGEVYVKPIGSDDRDRYDQFQNAKRFPEEGKEDKADWGGIRARLVSLGLCDEHGDLLGFSELELRELGKKGAALERCFDRIRDISGMTVKAAEQAEKNLSETQTENSG